MANVKALLTKVWKNEEAYLSTGKHDTDLELVVRVQGTVEKHDDQMVAPTVSIPLVTTLALFWEKAGLNRDIALDLLRESLTEAMDDGMDENHQITQRIDDVQTAVKAVKQDLIAQPPKMPRTGKVITKGLNVTVQPLHEDALAVV
jgi:hypothetical protein